MDLFKEIDLATGKWIENLKVSDLEEITITGRVKSYYPKQIATAVAVGRYEGKKRVNNNIEVYH